MTITEIEEVLEMQRKQIQKITDILVDQNTTQELLIKGLKNLADKVKELYEYNNRK